ncbi:MAG TPA: hypothetical protein PLV92_27320, partial [Pirellulaceae bacterium]|nr:hypothetical protein [Pirellulaceae bacterium]
MPPLEPPIAAPPPTTGLPPCESLFGSTPAMVVPLPTAKVATVSATIAPQSPPSGVPSSPQPNGSRASVPNLPPIATRPSGSRPLPPPVAPPPVASPPVASPSIAIPPAPVGAGSLPGEEPGRWRDFFHAQASAWISLCVHAVALIALSLVMIGEKVREQFVVVAGVVDGDDALEAIIDLPLTDPTIEAPDAPNLAEALALNPDTMQTLADDAGGAPGELADVVTGGLENQITETVARLTGGGEGDGSGAGQGDGLGGLGLDGDFKKMIENAQQNGLDLVIVFDSTGSMGAEIEGVKRQIFQIGSALLKKVPTTRISLVTYRDKGPGEQFDVQ